jgi:hypothetical protein
MSLYTPMACGAKFNRGAIRVNKLEGLINFIPFWRCYV